MGLKDRLGRAAYVWSASQNLRSKPSHARIKIDGVTWYDDAASCILLVNVGRLFGTLTVFPAASPDDGCLEVGVVTADGLLDWARVLARTVSGTAPTSPLTQVTQAHRVKVRPHRKVRYELDGGDRSKVKRVRVDAMLRAIRV